MARNRRRMHHRASRIKIFPGPLSGPRTPRLKGFALRARISPPPPCISPQPQHQPLFFKVGEHCMLYMWGRLKNPSYHGFTLRYTTYMYTWSG